jgi:hypothetical protein
MFYAWVVASGAAEAADMQQPNGSCGLPVAVGLQVN